MAIDLDPRESEILAGVLEDAVSEIRMEIAYTVKSGVRDGLRNREALLRRVVRELRGPRDEPHHATVRLSATRTSPTR